MAAQPFTQLLRQPCSSQFLSSHAPQSTGQTKKFLKDAWNMTMQTITLLAKEQESVHMCVYIHIMCYRLPL